MPSLDAKPDKVPADAFRFVGELEFGDVAGDDPLAPVPIRIKARSAQPLNHWYWGRIVHDMDGMFSKPVIPFDYCHRSDEVVGSCDQQLPTNDGLEVAGELIPFVAGDRASEVAFKGRPQNDRRTTVPYEGSIFWGGDGVLLEQVGEGAAAHVNGYLFEGPGVIVRKWPLRGVAICPYGEDANTQVSFSRDHLVAVQYKEQAMSKATEKPEEKPVETPVAETPAVDPKPEEKPVETPVAETPAEEKPAGDPPADPPAAETTEHSEGQRFLEKFGKQGAVWYVEGKSYDEAATLFAAQQQGQIDAKQAEIDSLRTKLTAAQAASGEADPVSFTAEEAPAADKEEKEFAAQLGNDNLAKFATAIKSKLGS